MRIHAVAIALVIACLMTHEPLAEETRPKIGLVLGGGGALGFAHIGVLQELEELQIPIDYIAGTSMGAIVAGMYASGMSPDEIAKCFSELNWWDVLKDRSPNQFLTYRRKQENKRFMGAEFGLKDWQITFSPGMAFGQKLNNVLETFSLNSAGITDFDQLNIPYRAVATDLRSGTSVVLRKGSLATAMRASMAVPGAFTPVRMDGMVLVDGGILNNIPVDVVKDMGADIIIAVDVGASAAQKSQHSNFDGLGDVVARTYSIMQRPDQERQLTQADLVIAPDLSAASASQFHRSGHIVPAGKKAASEHADWLGKLSVGNEIFKSYLGKQRARHTEKIFIEDIRIEGDKSVPDSAIRSRIRSKTGPIHLSTVYDDLNRIHGMGLFQTVTYDLEPTDENYELIYRPIEKFWGPDYLHFGMKLEAASNAKAIWSLLLNYTQTQLNPLGGEVRTDLEIGGDLQKFDTEWYQPINHSGTLFLAPSATLSSQDIAIYNNDSVVADIKQRLAYGRLEAGISAFEYGEFRAGILGGHALAKGNAGFVSLGQEDDAVLAATTRLRLDQLDDPVFPTCGYRIEIDGIFAFDEMGSAKEFDRLELKTIAPFSLGRHTVIPGFSAGTSFGTELPFYAVFAPGGLNEFAGFAPYQLVGYYYGIGSLGYRYQLGKLPPTIGNGVFALFRADAGNAWFDASDIRFDNINVGGLGGLAADTIIGTCALAVGKAEGIRYRFYFSLGNTF
jgi:NTE family protein